MVAELGTGQLHGEGVVQDEHAAGVHDWAYEKSRNSFLHSGLQLRVFAESFRGHRGLGCGVRYLRLLDKFGTSFRSSCRRAHSVWQSGRLEFKAIRLSTLSTRAAGRRHVSDP